MVGVFGLKLAAWAAPAEIIRDFTVSAHVNQDSSVMVQEIITYDFGVAEKHGIFRTIPLAGPTKYDLQIEVQQVVDEQGQNIPFTQSSGDALTVKIGEANRVITGVHTYTISYRVDNALAHYDDHTEWYWNVTGNQWPVPITNAKAVVTWATGTLQNAMCYTGAEGSTEQACDVAMNTNEAVFTASRSFEVGEGLTIVLGWPRGIFATSYVDNSLSREDWRVIAVLVSVAVGLIVLTIIPIINRMRKYKPKIPRALKRQPLVVEYNPPADLRPIEVGALVDRTVDVGDISAVIMDLAVRGYLKIRYTETKGLFGNTKKDFTLVRVADAAGLTDVASVTMFNFLFQERSEVALSALEKERKAFEKIINTIKNDVPDALRTAGYYDQTTKAKSKRYAIIMVSLFGLAFVVGAAGLDFLLVPLVAAFIILIFVLRYLDEKLSPLGLQTLGKILGFREFLVMTETDRLRILNAPEVKPEIFEKWLAYAMVLGAEKQWASKFEHLYQQTPVWYEGPVGAQYSTTAFVNQMQLFGQNFNHAVNVAAPRSASGFSGGSSGGGFGGGGGGSW